MFFGYLKVRVSAVFGIKLVDFHFGSVALVPQDAQRC